MINGKASVFAPELFDLRTITGYDKIGICI